jgi:hypothetical protein
MNFWLAPYMLFAFAHAHLHLLALHKNKHLPGPVLVFYLVLFKALFNTLFKMTPITHTHTRARVEINAANNAELRANAQQILILTRAERPKGTSLAYEPKQKEFRVGDLALVLALALLYL